MSNPDQLLFSKTHEWSTGKEGEVMIGISSHAVEQLGDVIFMELPEKGDVFHAGDAFGTIESTKTVSELCAPVSGEVVAVNEDIQADPSSLSDDPYMDGWLIKMVVKGEVEELMSVEEYESYISDS